MSIPTKQVRFLAGPYDDDVIVPHLDDWIAGMIKVEALFDGGTVEGPEGERATGLYLHDHDWFDEDDRPIFRWCGWDRAPRDIGDDIEQA